jgi:hypothetical protein
MEMSSTILSKIDPTLRQAYPVELDRTLPMLVEFIETVTAPQQRGSSAIMAVMLYGSCLNKAMRSATSMPDFYLVIDNYYAYHRSRCKAALNAWLPPSIYTYKGSKFCVISIDDLRRETSEQARDVYNMGRFSKRFSLSYVRDPAAYDAIINAAANAMFQVLWRSLPLLPQRFSTVEAIQHALKISYLGDVRVEADDKVHKIYESQKSFYDAIFQPILEELPKQISWLQAEPSLAYFTQQVPSELLNNVQEFLQRSRKNSQWRWPKYAITNKNWVDYMLAKIQRTQGIKIELKPHERRFIAIFAWKYVWQLRRKKNLK